MTINQIAGRSCRAKERESERERAKDIWNFENHNNLPDLSRQQRQQQQQQQQLRERERETGKLSQPWRQQQRETAADSRGRKKLAADRGSNQQNMFI